MPHITKPDGNCLFNMISISLVGNESLSNLLRALTVFTLVNYRKDYFKIIRTEEMFHNNNSDIDKLNEIVINKFNSILYDAKTNGIWCNEYHLSAISTFLNSNIYIYSTFFNRINGQIFQHASTTEELQHFFNQNIRTGAHLIYKPLQYNNTASFENLQPLYGFFSSISKHFTSIIPISGNAPKFTPHNNLISIQ